jgi:DNA-binding CsgD family transcriptional regulator
VAELANGTLPACPEHPRSLVRRYRAYGPGGPGVYPQCVPLDGDEPHLLAWPQHSSGLAMRDSASSLSESELEVLVDAAHGMTVHESAAHRSKGPETVKSQRKAILLKVGARNMAQAVGMIVRQLPIGGGTST